MTIAALVTILSLHLLAAISPGPAFVVAVRIAASEGFRSAASLALGFGIGAAIWASAAIFGLALLFEAAPQMLWVLRIVGALFLLYIAVQTWRHASDPVPVVTKAVVPDGLGPAFRLGLFTQLANPKPAIFFGAVFVGLIPPDTTNAAIALVLGLICLNETLWYVFVGRVFSLPATRNAYVSLKSWIDRLFGGLMAALALKIALD